MFKESSRELAQDLEVFTIWLKTKRLGFDLDGVNINIASEALRIFNRKFGTAYEKSDLRTDYEMVDWMKDFMAADECLTEAINIWNSDEALSVAGPESGSIQMQEYLRDNGINPFFITSRPSYALSYTENWMAKWLPWVPGENVCIQKTGGQISHDFKALNVSGLGIDFMFEDSIRNAQAIVEASVSTVVALVPQPWNLFYRQRLSQLRHPRIVIPEGEIYDSQRPPIWNAYLAVARYSNFI